MSDHEKDDRIEKDPAGLDALLGYLHRERNFDFTGYKRPKYIEFRDELPKTNVGKILRRELRG